MRDPRFFLDHEIYIDSSTAGFNLLGPDGIKWFNKFFGSNATVEIKFNSHWDKHPAEPEAGFPLPYYEVSGAEITSIYATTTFCGEEYAQELDWKKLKKDDQDFIMQYCVEYASTCGEEPNDIMDFMDEEIGYGPDDND